MDNWIDAKKKKQEAICSRCHETFKYYGYTAPRCCPICTERIMKEIGDLGYGTGKGGNCGR